MASGNAQQRARLTYQPEWYTPAALMSGRVTEADARKEYTRLRDIAQKRLKRIGQSMFRDTQAYRLNVDAYPKLKDIRTAGKLGRPSADLAYKLSALARFVAAEQGSVAGMTRIMEKNLRTLHSNGYTFVTKKNYLNFAKFMEEWRAQGLDKEYDSGDTADLYEQVERHHMDPARVAEEFEYWLENRKELEQLRPSKSKGTQSSRKVKDRIERAKKRRAKNAKRNGKASGRYGKSR